MLLPNSIGRNHDIIRSAVSEVNHVWQILGIRQVVGDKASDATIAHLDAADEFMDGNIIQQRQVGISIACDVRRLDIIISEVTEQRTLQPPLGVQLRVGRDVAEVVGNRLPERQGGIATIHLRTDDVEDDVKENMDKDDEEVISKFFYINTGLSQKDVEEFMDELKSGLVVDEAEPADEEPEDDPEFEEE